MGGTGRSIARATIPREAAPYMGVLGGVAGMMVGNPVAGAAIGQAAGAYAQGRSNQQAFGEAAVAGGLAYGAGNYLTTGSVLGGAAGGGGGSMVSPSGVGGVAPAAGAGGTQTGMTVGGLASKYATPLMLAGGLGLSAMGGMAEQDMSEDMYNQQKQDYAATYQQQKGDLADMNAANMGTYEQYSLPNPELIESLKRSSTAEINRRATMGQRSLNEAMAARGITGGGLAEQSEYDQEMERQRQISGMSSDLTQFANTRQFSPPYQTGIATQGVPQQQPYNSATMRMADFAGDVGGGMAGMYAYNQWMKPNNQQNPQYNPYSWG